MRNTKPLAKLLGYSAKNYTSAAAVIKYELFHLMYSFLSISLASLLWHSYWAHTIYCLFIFGIVVYNGASRYVYIMTQSYHKSLEKLANSKEEKA